VREVRSSAAVASVPTPAGAPLEPYSSGMTQDAAQGMVLFVVDEHGPDDPPNWCFKTNANGDLPTCTYLDGQWHRSYDKGPGLAGADGPGGAFAALLVLALLAGIGFTVWKVSTARRMARDSGMSVGDATAMTLLSDDGFEATYLASNLRQPTSPPATPAVGGSGSSRSAADRLRELESLLAQGLISPTEYDARRQAIVDGL
jgi:hypothetical protein